MLRRETGDARRETQAAPSPLRSRLRRRDPASARPRAAGFTLIEILVVVVIIGILVTFATLSIGDRALDDQLEIEARRLDKILRLALEEAETQGVELGFRYTESGYEFLAVGEEGEWQRLETHGLLRPRTIAAPFYLELRIEGRPVPPAVEPENKDAKIEPQVFLLSSGELTAFSLDLKAPHHASYFTLAADALGRFTLERRQEAS